MGPMEIGLDSPAARSNGDLGAPLPGRGRYLPRDRCGSSGPGAGTKVSRHSEPSCQGGAGLRTSGVSALPTRSTSSAIS
jgi:hypothetical protein